MSHYITSFLVEPVVRQARRFSRPSSSSETPLVEQQQSHHIGGRGGILQPLETPQEIPYYQATDRDGQEAGITWQHVQSLHISDDGGLEQQVQSSGQTASSAATGQRLTPASTTDSSGRVEFHPDLPADSETSDNPLSAIREHFRSAGASLSGFILENEMTPVDAEGPSQGNMVRGDARIPQGNPTGRVGIGPIPEDDGMGMLRKRIIEIHRMESSGAEKSRLIHQLMNERYTSSQSSLHLSSSPSARPLSRASVMSQDRPWTPGSILPVNNLAQSPRASIILGGGDNFYRVSPEDLMPTYYTGITTTDRTTEPRENSKSQEEEDEFDDDAKPLGCEHYKRNVKLQCATCARWYTCRFCHDEVEDHALIRRETKNMLCMLCGCAQAAAESCKDCGVRGAWYYCDVCKLWEDDPNKSIYHCGDCGICRRGQGLGKDFFHCKTCCACLDMAVRDTHKCVERSTDCDCPICGEYMFTSPKPVVFMPCGHSIHRKCYGQHIQNAYKCPICSKSVRNMEMQFRHLTRSIESQPMPPQFQDTKALIYCNDCRAKPVVKYHWLGLKCAVCDSYNTAELQILSEPAADADIVQPGRSDSTFERRDMDTLSPEPLQPAPRERALGDPELHPRLAASTSTLEALRAISLRTSQTRPTRSTSATMLNRIADLAVNEHARPSHLMDTDDSGADIDFWGGDFARARDAGAAVQDGSEDMDESDASDLDDDADDDDDDDDEDDYMELFGHR